MELKKIIDFLARLSENNNREWFNDHKKEFTLLKKQFEEYIDYLIPKINKIDPTIGSIKAKDCIFRIYRDVRFSKNKQPYKTHFGAYIASGGRKSKTCGYYIHIEPGNSFIAAGAYSPEPNILKEIRYEIMDHTKKFKEIIENETFKEYFPELAGERLKTAPKGFPKDYEDIELIRLKSYEVFHIIDDKEVQSENFENTLLEIISVALPYNNFFNKVIEFVLANNE